MNFTTQRAFSNFVMQTTKVMTKVKEIIINSPKYGQKIILIDEEDYELVSKYTWCIAKPKRSKTFYAAGWVNGKVIRLHRLLMSFPNKGIDHADGNGLNNCKYNLRECSQSQNNANSVRNNKNGYKGIYYKSSHKCYVARIQINGLSKIIGRRKTAIEAAKLYNDFAVKYFGEFARLNPIHS